MRGERRTPALYDRKTRTEFRVDIGLPDGEPVNDVLIVLLHAAAPELLVEDREGELDGPEHVLAPGFFRILLRVRVLEGKSIRGRGIEGRTLAVGETRREVRVIARLSGV